MQLQEMHIHAPMNKHSIYLPYVCQSIYFSIYYLHTCTTDARRKVHVEMHMLAPMCGCMWYATMHPSMQKSIYSYHTWTAWFQSIWLQLYVYVKPLLVYVLSCKSNHNI